MARQDGGSARQGYGLFEREAALAAAEEALDLLTGLAESPPWTEHVPAPREPRGPRLVAVPDPGTEPRTVHEARDAEDTRHAEGTADPSASASGPGRAAAPHAGFDGPARPQVLRRGGILAYAAPAGLGKTTLLAEIRRRAAARGCTVLSARGGDQE
ncbi:hypothetical protein [Streptomyces venezuelae]|uniref:hypothetical protein n=1 Tax=Streptomyces venezuelae TaxID=54571 RepID=UPI00295F4FC1|nr:hypothetical protein [Streptomyces venezuelae]